MNERTKIKTAFVTEFGKFQCHSIQKNALPTFQWMMDNVLDGMYSFARHIDVHLYLQ